MLSYRLVPKAHAEDRNILGKSVEYLKRNARRVRCSRAGRDQDLFRLQIAFYLVHRDLVVAKDLHLGSELAEVLDEVVRERIVIVDYQQHIAPSPNFASFLKINKRRPTLCLPFVFFVLINLLNTKNTKFSTKDTKNRFIFFGLTSIINRHFPEVSIKCRSKFFLPH